MKLQIIGIITFTDKELIEWTDGIQDGFFKLHFN